VLAPRRGAEHRLQAIPQVRVSRGVGEGRGGGLQRRGAIAQRLAGEAELGHERRTLLIPGRPLWQRREQGLEGLPGGGGLARAQGRRGEGAQDLRVVGGEHQGPLQEAQRLPGAREGSLLQRGELDEGARGGGELAVGLEEAREGRERLREGGQVAAPALERAELGAQAEIVGREGEGAGERVGGEVEVASEVPSGPREPLEPFDFLAGVLGELREANQEPTEPRPIGARLAQARHGAEGALAVGVQEERLLEELTGPLRLAQRALEELAGLGQEGGALFGVGRGGRADLAGALDVRRARRLAPGGEQLSQHGGVVRGERRGGLQVGQGRRGVPEVVAGDARQGAAGAVRRRPARGPLGGDGEPRLGQDERALPRLQGLGGPARLFVELRQPERGLGLPGGERCRLLVAEQRVAQVPQRLFPDGPGAKAGAGLEGSVARLEGRPAELVEGAQRAQGLAVGLAELGEGEDRLGVVGGLAQGGVELKAGGGAVSGQANEQAGEPDAGAGGLERVARQGRDAAVRVHGALGLPRAIGGGGQREEAAQVVGPASESVLERPAGENRGVVGESAARGGEGVKRARLLGAIAGEGGELQEALPGGPALAAGEPKGRLDPVRGGRAGAGAEDGRGQVQGQVVGVGPRREEPEEPLLGEGRGVARLAPAQEVGLGGGQVALGEERLALGEGARALDRGEQLLVERGVGPSIGGKVEVEGPRPGLDAGEPGVAHLRQPKAAQGNGLSQQGRDRVHREPHRAEGRPGGDRLCAECAAGEEGRQEGRGQRRGPVETDVEDDRQDRGALRLEADAEGEGRRAAGGVELPFALEPARAQVELKGGDVVRARGQGAADGEVDELVVELEVEIAEAALLLLVPGGRAAGDVEGKGDVGHDEREVAERQPVAQGRRAEADVDLAVVDAQLGRGEAGAARPPRGLGGGLRLVGIGVCGHGIQRREALWARDPNSGSKGAKNFERSSFLWPSPGAILTFVMEARSKVIAMPEEQFVGALERAVERLSTDVESALRALEGQRDLKARADEVIRGPAGRARVRALGRRNHGVRNR
jgi:hypothetical protein